MKHKYNSNAHNSNNNNNKPTSYVYISTITKIVTDYNVYDDINNELCKQQSLNLYQYKKKIDFYFVLFQLLHTCMLKNISIFLKILEIHVYKIIIINNHRHNNITA